MFIKSLAMTEPDLVVAEHSGDPINARWLFPSSEPTSAPCHATRACRGWGHLRETAQQLPRTSHSRRRDEDINT